MKTKSLQSYLQTRLSKEELAEIEQQVDAEIQNDQRFQKLFLQNKNQNRKKVVK